MKTIRRLSIAVLAALLLFSAVAPATAQSNGACVHVNSEVVAARFSGVSLQTLSGALGGKGIYVHSAQFGTASTTVGARITTAAVLDADLSTITPAFAFGPGAPETVVRQGTAPAGAVEGDMIQITLAMPLNGVPIYVPPSPSPRRR